MNKDAKSLATLADVEREVVAEYRELGRQRLEQRLQALADQIGEVSPLRQRQRRPLTLRTELGWVTLTVDYGQEPQTQKWFCPQQRAWGLSPHQKLTPGLAEKLCFTAVATTSYAQAAGVAACWGVPVDDALIHAQVQRAGERADQQAQARIPASAMLAPTPKTTVAPGALVIMMDGWMLRHRGDDWGVDLPIGLRATLFQGFEEALSIRVIAEDGLVPVPSIPDVVKRACVFDPQLAWHGRKQRKGCGSVNGG